MDIMKRLWLTVISLSIVIFFLTDLSAVKGQEQVVPQYGKGSCWKIVQDSQGFQVFEFFPSTSSCGWFTVSQLTKSTAGSDIGWNGYIKIINPSDPKAAFYLGSTFPMRSLKFGKNLKGENPRIACYICEPDNTNCLPNDPSRSDECFSKSKSDRISCLKQVHCPKVVEITECYQKGEGVFAQVYNDLALCGEPEINLLNVSGAGGNSYTDQDATTYHTAPELS